MSRLRFVALLACLLLAPTGVRGETYVVDVHGNGDFLSLPEAFQVAGGSDTLLVAPGTYYVGGTSTGWPLYIDAGTPWVIGQEGADRTLFLADGSTVGFVVTGAAGGRARFKGIAFFNFGELLARECEYGDCGCYLKLLDCLVDHCGSDYGVDARWCLSESCEISGCTIRNSPGGGIFTYHYFGRIENCEICYNGCGTSGLCCEEPVIRGNYIHHNSGNGVSCTWSYRIEDNTITDNGGAGVYVSSSSTITGNLITRNHVGVLHNGYGWVTPGNAIYGNDTYNLKFSEYASPGERNVTMNWWGTTDEEEIRAGIWDCEDDPAVSTCALIEPWCTNPECVVTPVESSTWGSIKAMYRR